LISRGSRRRWRCRRSTGADGRDRRLGVSRRTWKRCRADRPPPFTAAMSQQELDHQGVVPCQPITRRQRETCLAVPNTGLEPGPPVDASPVPETLPEHVAGDPDEPSRDRGDGLESGVRPRPQSRFCSSDGGIDLASAPLTSWLGTGPDFLSSLLSDGGGPWAPPRSGGTMQGLDYRSPRDVVFFQIG
jgi:hypothetical protein